MSQANATRTATVATQTATKTRQNSRRISAPPDRTPPRGGDSRTFRAAETQQQVAAAVHGGDRGCLRTDLAELAPQIGDVHVDRTVERPERTAEHGL